MPWTLTEFSLLWHILHWLNGILVTESVVWPLQFSRTFTSYQHWYQLAITEHNVHATLQLSRKNKVTATQAVCERLVQYHSCCWRCFTKWNSCKTSSLWLMKALTDYLHLLLSDMLTALCLQLTVLWHKRYDCAAMLITVCEQVHVNTIAVGQGFLTREGIPRGKFQGHSRELGPQIGWLKPLEFWSLSTHQTCDFVLQSLLILSHCNQGCKLDLFSGCLGWRQRRSKGRGGHGVLGDGTASPLPPASGLGEHSKLPQWGPGPWPKLI